MWCVHRLSPLSSPSQAPVPARDPARRSAQPCANGPPATTSWLLCWPVRVPPGAPVWEGHTAHDVHLRCPCFVMIGAVAGRTPAMLPQMHHRMGEGREHLLCATSGTVRRVQGNLIGDCPGLVIPALARERPIGAILALHGNETLWQLPRQRARY